ncbi:hypothetical protein PG987_009050 [Apiospora arundinis]
MASEQQKAILFYVMMMTNPDLSGGNWAEISSRLGLKSDSVSNVPTTHDNQVHDISVTWL